MGISEAIAELSSLLGQGLSLSKSDLDLHGASESYFDTIPPDAVAYPRATKDVAAIVLVCARHKIPLIG